MLPECVSEYYIQSKHVTQVIDPDIPGIPIYCQRSKSIKVPEANLNHKVKIHQFLQKWLRRKPISI